MSSVIEIEGLSKRYRLGVIGSGTLYRDLQSWYARLRGRDDPNSELRLGAAGAEPDRQEGEYYWALRDVDLSVQQGEILGIIGKNGAGKSTLLKLLSRVTAPTAGRIKLRGRVASLLEVGTGFHPELTGRENIYLNGAILGMNRAEIRVKFDEIVDFSGIAEYVDTPVKRYSSGMYVRLAFAVAAHLEPEILIVDEVLAVGDHEFQKRCLGKMESVSRESGRTILFVSHNMPAVSNLCKRAVMLEGGRVTYEGNTLEVVDRYVLANAALLDIPLAERRDRSGEGHLRFVRAWTENDRGEKTDTFQSGSSAIIAAEYETRHPRGFNNLSVGFALYGKNEVQLTDLKNTTTGDVFASPLPKNGVLRCRIDRLPLNQGSYMFNAILRTDQAIEDFIITAGKFDVIAGDFFGSGNTVDPEQGMVLFDHRWSLQSA